MLIHLEKLGKSFGEKIVLHDVTASVERVQETKSLYIMKKHVSFTERNLIRILSIKYSITRECRRL